MCIFAASFNKPFKSYHMNKTDLVNAIAERADLSKVDAKNALDAAIAAIADALVEGEKVTLVGFGTFAVAEKAARTGFNPRSKETIEIPARKAIKFKPGADLEAKVK
ncbi:MAG: HU family DNA-binding protein [Bacteroidales bacterium]|nr:HU family DNA-binding protein [Bacteroidales bacterium]